MANLALDKTIMENLIPIEQQKLIALEILKDLWAFCKRNNLRIFLAYGSLIGAIRHKGFIPWDDDIDVLMPREDYEILLNSYPATSRYKLYHNGNNPTYTKAFASLNDIRTCKLEYNVRDKFSKDLCINVDIFPLDNMPDSPAEQKKVLSLALDRDRKLQCLTSKYKKGRTFSSTIKKFMGISVMRFFELIHIISLQSYLERTIHLIKNNVNSNTGWVACLSNPWINKSKEIVPRELFESKIMVEFEGLEFPAPIGYDKFLKSIYGDYMKLPPVSERVPHHLCKCYWR